MTTDEIKKQLEQISLYTAELEQKILSSCAELGEKLLPTLAEDSEHAPLAAEIRHARERLAALQKEQADMDTVMAERLEALTCFACKTVNPEGATFCEDCGAKLGEKPKEYCEGCGAMNHPGQKFCGQCGAKLET